MSAGPSRDEFSVLLGFAVFPYPVKQGSFIKSKRKPMVVNRELRH